MFNEREYLPKAVNAAREALSGLTRDFEIIIVDDASTDGSQTIADTLAAADDHIRVIHHKTNRKLGGVLKTGFRAAEKDIVVYTDMDMPFDFVLLKDILPLIKDADIINGCRITYEESFRRKLYSKVYNVLIRSLFGLKVKDVNFALKIFRKDILKSLPLKSEGSFISAEYLIRSQYRGCRILEIPVDYRPRRWGRSRLSSPAVIAKIIVEMLILMPELFGRRLAGAVESAKNGIYQRFRTRTCPFDEVCPHVPGGGSIYDLGCGYGTFAEYYRRNSTDRAWTYTGFDIDIAKIRSASRRYPESNMRFEIRDVTGRLDVRNADCILMIDLLMLLPFREQEALLHRCFNLLSKEGKLVIKDIDKRPVLKYLVHQIQEFICLKLLRLVKGKGIYLRHSREYRALLEKIGYTVDIKNIHRGYPYPHILYLCSKG
jgi:2-polyprenyl-3-methyl-5-hydroxy-6-metoxy-1,4-benzoquinol methylase